jgi:CRP/FNR family transcriptional regulator, cyclic AMP receptor protein
MTDGSRVTLGSMVGDAISENAPRRSRGMGRGGVALLRGVPLFAGLSTRHLRHLASHAEEVRYGANRVIVRQGARGDSFFVIAEGEATVRQGTRKIGTLGPGDFFGEMALLDGRPRSASVTADTPLVTVRLTRAAFTKALDANPALARAIMAELAARIRRLESARGRT